MGQNQLYKDFRRTKISPQDFYAEFFLIVTREGSICKNQFQFYTKVCNIIQYEQSLFNLAFVTLWTSTNEIFKTTIT